MAGSTVLVLGGGIGGVVAATTVRRLLPPEHRVVLVEREAQHVFWPSLLWLMTGSRTAVQVQRDLAPLTRRGVEVIHGEVTSFDAASQTAVVDGGPIRADATVIALGARLAPERVPGLVEGGHNFFTLDGAARFFESLRGLRQGRVVVLIARTPFKCPAAPYEAAFLVDHYLRRQRLRERVEVVVYAAEAAPMAVAGPAVSDAVVDFMRKRDIPYHPGESVLSVDPAGRRLAFSSGSEAEYSLLAAVPPHEVPPVLREANLAPEGGWVGIDPATCETAHPNVFAVGDATGVMLAMGKPLPKAGVFAHAQADAVAHTIAARLLGRGTEQRFDGSGECFLELGEGKAAFARGNFYAQPMPDVRLFGPGRHWHAGKVAFERMWWQQWF